MRDGAGDVLLGAGDGIRQLTTERQTGGHGGRKRAPGPVRVPCVDPGRVEFVEHMTIKEQIDVLVFPPCVPAGDDHGRRAHVLNPSRGLARLLSRSNAPAAQRFGFGDVRRHGARERHQLHAQRLHAVGVQQPLPARRGEHGIHHDQRQLQFLDGCRHRFDDRGRGEHADLRRMESEIAGDRFDLGRHEVGRERRHGLDTFRALDGDGSDRARAVQTERRKRLEIGLNAGAAAGVAACDCQRCTHTLRSAVMYPTLLDAVTTRSDSRFRAAEQAGAVLFVTVLTAIAAQISVPLPFTPVPFTFQPMVVLVGAAALGSRLGMFSQILYLALGIAGLPVFAASPLLPQGAARLLGPTGGYLMSYPFAAFVAGALAERGFDRRYLTAVVAMVCGLAVVFAGGILWLTIAGQPSHSLSSALAAGFFPFIIPDLLKLLVAASVLPGLWKIT